MELYDKGAFWLAGILTIFGMIFILILFHIFLVFLVFNYFKIYKKKIINYSDNTLFKLLVKHWNKLIVRDIFYYFCWVIFGLFFDLSFYLFAIIFIPYIHNILYGIDIWSKEMIVYYSIITPIYLIGTICYLIHSILFYKKYKSTNLFESISEVEIDREDNGVDNKFELKNIWSNEYFINRTIKYANIISSNFNKSNKKTSIKVYWYINFMLWRYLCFYSRVTDDNQAKLLTAPLFCEIVDFKTYKLNYLDQKIEVKTAISCFRNEIINIFSKYINEHN